jgi:hypothetical protein
MRTELMFQVQTVRDTGNGRLKKDGTVEPYTCAGEGGKEKGVH